MIVALPVTVLALVTLLLYRRLVRAPGYGSRGVRYGAIAMLTLLAGSLIVGFVHHSGSFDNLPVRVLAMVGMVWLGTGFYLSLGVALGALVALALRVSGRRDSVRTWHRVSVPVIIVASLLITTYGVVEGRNLRITETTVAVPDLPARFEGYRLAVLSDLHVGPIRGARFTATVVTAVNGIEPDAVLIAGDMVDGTTRFFGRHVAPLARLAAPDGAYVVTGNHEYYGGDASGWVERWRDLGLIPLLNESRTISRGGQTIRIVGVNDAAGAGHDDTRLRPDLTAALSRVVPQEATILLAHQPVVGTDPLVRAAGIDLVVAGHTHAGQIWPFRYAVGLANPTVSGLDTVAGTRSFTTRGAGTWGPPLRVLAPPEVAVLALTAG